jgi:hypothetical protein
MAKKTSLLDQIVEDHRTDQDPRHAGLQHHNELRHTSAQERRRERDSKRHTVTIDMPPELEAIIDRLAEGMMPDTQFNRSGCSRSQMIAYLCIQGIIQVQAGAINPNDVAITSAGRHYKFSCNLDLSKLMTKLRDGS